tara:strand:- start:1546 stop:1740 length:195 start_codon:yes stop_codon:yes gene_type:complete
MIDFNNYKKPIIILVAFFLIDVVAPLILNVMGIKLSTFTVYLIWLNALLIAYIILPNNVGSAFL